MKKINYIPLILLIVASCANPAPGDKDKSETAVAVQTDSVTLNGYTFAEAETMVRSFIRDGYSPEKQSSIWFSKNYIDNLESILVPEGIDGIRIYFARKGAENKIVIVATKETKIQNPKDPNIFTHRDYFTIKSPFFKPGNNPDILGISENGPPEALMYSAAESDCTTIPCNTLRNTISCAEGNKWVNQFSQGGPLTTTSLWYPIEVIQTWKKELDAAIQNNADGDGIRIYFAKNDKHRNIFVMTTTRIKDGQKRTDYYECYFKHPLTNNQEKIAVNNNGEECPNNCNDVTWQ